MKKFFWSIIVLVAVWAWSCTDSSDFMDPEADTTLTEEAVFAEATYAMRFLTSIYGEILPVIPQARLLGTRLGGDVLLEVNTDDGSTNQSGTYLAINRGAWTFATSTFSSSEWASNWNTIRACNMFLLHIDNVPDNPEMQFDARVRSIRKGEGLFLKAFFYFELFKQFGGLPLEDRVIRVGDDMNIPRNTVDETVEYIAKLCDDAADLLSLKTEQPSGEYGRANKGMALALKARLLLYAASPLWNNPDNPEDSPFRGSYDAAKWRRAAEAAADVIKMNQYSLHTNISNQFLMRYNEEMIFMHLQQPCGWFTQLSIPPALCHANRGENKSGTHQVTYNLIREYETLKDGVAYSIDDPASGYDPQNPYINRDPRFYRDCMFNGFKYQGQTCQFGIPDYSGSPQFIAFGHNPPYPSSGNTHVYSIKYADLDVNINYNMANPGTAGDKAHQNYQYIRYAEILMNYAEAMNEAFGPEVDGLSNEKTALWAVNEVRTRSQYQDRQEYLGQTGGMPPIRAGLNKEQMREKIRHERRIEFSFEEHRFWDVRRWRLDFTPLNVIQIQEPVWSSETEVEYVIRTIETRGFSPRTYRMPIPELQLYNNPNLVQNPGWELSTEPADAPAE